MVFSVMILLNLLLLFVQRVSSTHWAYGTVIWELEPAFKSAGADNLAFSNVPGSTSSRKSYKFLVKMGWRWSYAWPGGARPAKGTNVQLSGCQPTARLRFFKQGSCDQNVQNGGVLAMSQYSFDQLNARCCHNWGPGPNCQSNGASQSDVTAYDCGPPTETRMRTSPQNLEISNPKGQTQGDTLYRCPLDASTTDKKMDQNRAKSAPGKYDIILTVTNIFNSDDWFLGETKAFYVFHPVETLYDYNIEFYYEDCCRLSDPHASKPGIKNGNNDRWFRIQGVISYFQRYSPIVQGTARVRLRQNVINYYWLFAIHTQGNVLEYAWTGTPKSRLVTQQPRDPDNGDNSATKPGWAYKTMVLNGTTGVAIWEPRDTARGLYAVNFAVIDTGLPKPAPGQPIPAPYQRAQRSWIPLDFLFEVSPEPGPYFTHPFHEFDPLYPTPDTRKIYFNVNNEDSYSVCARDDIASVWVQNFSHFQSSPPNTWWVDNPVTMVRGRPASVLTSLGVEIFNPSGELPTYSNWFERSGFTNGASNPMCWVQTWRPGYGDPDQVATYYAKNTNGTQSIGLYQLYLIVRTDILYVSGIIRDFHKGRTNGSGHPDFDWTINSGNQGFDRGIVSASNNQGLVMQTLGSNGKPRWRLGLNTAQSTSKAVTNRTWLKMPDPDSFNASLGELPNIVQCDNDTTCELKGGFYDWFLTDEQGLDKGYNLTSLINMQRVYSVALAKLNSSLNVFTYFAGSFYPIDGQLLGNEGDSNNYFFTWEIKTFLTYKPGDVLRYESVDDMWVYIDGKIPTGWNLGGIPGYFNPATVPPPFPFFEIQLNNLGLMSGITYRVDIFYAHRSRRAPGIKIELPDFSICDGLSEGEVVIDIPKFLDTSNLNLAFGNDINDANWIKKGVTLPGFTTTYDTLQLLRQLDSKSTVWYRDPNDGGDTANRAPSLVKLLNGFRAEFSFIIQCTGDKPCAEGFAFVLHRNDNNKLAGGQTGAGLGYSGTSRVFAVEFDASYSTNVDVDTYSWNPDIVWSEISFHTRYYDEVTSSFPIVDKIENGVNSRGRNTNVQNGLPIMDFSNGTFHTVKVEYQTGQKDTNGVQQPGYLRVFMNTNLAPVSEAQIESPAYLDKLLGGAAYIGFTASNSANLKADIFITNWRLVLVTTDAFNTVVVSKQDIVAGNTGCVLVQAKDTCDKDIVVGGEAKKFRGKYSLINCPTTATTNMIWNDPQKFKPGFTQLEPDDTIPSSGIITYHPIDNGNGTYTFCYNPTKAGQYKLDVTFQGVKINKGNDIFFNVKAAPVSPTRSKFRLPLPGMPWTYNMAGANKGIYARVFTGYGLTLPDGLVDEPSHVFATAADLNSYISTNMRGQRANTPGLTKPWAQPVNDLVAFALVGSSSIIPSQIVPALPTACFNGSAVPTVAFNANKAWACIVQSNNAGNGWTYVGPGTGASSWTEGETPRDNAGEFTMYYKGKDGRTSFQRDFVLAAESGVTANQCGNFGRIGSFHLDIPTTFYYRLPSKQFNSFTIEAVDDYGNLDTPGGTTWQVTLPNYPILSSTYLCGDGNCNTLNGLPVPGLESCITCPDDCKVEDSDCTAYESINKGYYTKAFAGNRAGVYSMNVFLAAGPLGNASNEVFGAGAKSPYGIVIEPGPACLATTVLLGTGVNPTAGELVENIQVNLKDCDGNAILRDREEDLINASLVGFGQYCISKAGACDPVPVNYKWECPANSDCSLKISYRPLKTTIMGDGPRDWNITFTINGQTGPKGQPQIRPNYWSPARSLPSTDCQPDSTYGKLVNSGEQFECFLQSRDAWDNDRWGTNNDDPKWPGQTDQDYRFSVLQGGIASTVTVTFTYANGNGRYFLRFTPTTASTSAKDLVITVTGYNNLTALVQIFKSPLSFTVLPGAPASTSILAASATVVNNNPPVPTPTLLGSSINVVASSTAACRFVIVSKDAANNLRWNAFGQTVIADEDYTVNVITSLDPPITAIVNKTQNAATTGVFEYEFHQESPSQFYKIVATTKTGASIVNSVFGAAPTGVRINPAPPFGPNSEAVGTGLSGCEQNKEVTFTFTPYDIYFNNEILYTDYPLETGSVEALEVKVGAGAVLASVTKDAVTTYPDTVERYQPRITYTVRYTCPSEGLFRIQLMINNSVTKNANCSNYALATNCSNFGCAGQTFGVCGRYREYWVQSFATPGTSYARLVRYEARPNNTLLRAGQTTSNVPPVPPVVDWWYVQNLDNAGQPKAPDSGDFFTVELTNPNLKIAITSSSMVQGQGAGVAASASRFWMKFTPRDFGEFTAKVFYKGAFQTKASLNGPDWVSDPFYILIGEVDPPKSNVEGLPATINAGDTRSFLVQLVDVYAQVHNAPYCVPSWNNITKQLVTSTTVNCDSVKARISANFVGIPDTVVDCVATTNNKYLCNYTRTVAGKYTVKVFTHLGEGNWVAKAEGYPLDVIAGPPDPTTSYLDPSASGSTENPYTAGEVNEATLYLKDKFGNPATVPSNFASTVGSNFGSGTGSVVMTKISSGSIATVATVAISVTKIALDTRMPYDPVSKKWKSGTNMFNLTFGGVTVSGSGSANFMLYSQPGVPCTRTLNNCQGGNVTALECPKSGTVAGEFMNLTLRVYDIYGNEWKGDQAMMHILMDQTSPAFNIGYESLAVSTEMPGVYYLKFQGDRTTFANAKLDGKIVAQNYLFKVELPGPVYVYSNESDAAQACKVTPAATDVDKCVLYALDDGEPVSTFAAQKPDTDISYLIITKDQYGNYQTGPKSEVFTMGYDQDARAPFGAVLCPSDSGIAESFNPVYNWNITMPIYNDSLKGFVYTANTIKAGVYTVSMVLNGQAASCSTRKLWVQTICPGDPDGSKSYFDVFWQQTVALPPRTVVAGTIWKVETVLLDRWGNPVVSSPSCNAGTAPVRIDNNTTRPRNDPTAGSNLTTWIRQVNINPACATLQNITCMHALSIKQLASTTDGRTTFEINVTEARLHPLVPSIQVNGEWESLQKGPALANWDQRVSVVAATAKRFSLKDSDKNDFTTSSVFIGTAAVPSEFILEPADWWLNPISDDSNFYYKVRFDAAVVDYGFEIPVSSLTKSYLVGGSEVNQTTCQSSTGCSIRTRASYMSSWHGSFSISASLYPLGSFVSTWSETLQKKLYHATCDFEFPTKKFRCADEPEKRHTAACQTAYSSCAQLDGETTVLNKARCSDGSHVDNALQCPCGSGESRSKTGVCYSTALTIVLSPCPTGTVVCPLISGTDSNQCRKSLNDCPSKRVCPPGFVTCGDGVTCARRIGPGPTCPQTVVCPSGLVPCWDGHCRFMPEDCPTQVTCSDPTHVVCSDGSCAPSRIECPDFYNCYVAGTLTLGFTCPDGSCRASRAGCPSKVTCPVGQLLCESGLCVENKVNCTAPIKCPYNQTRCPDGSCQHNLLFCPAEITCNSQVPVKCPDGSCARSVTNCGKPPACPANAFRCSDGYCVLDIKNCPTPASCPVDKPVLCQDGRCVNDPSLCSVQLPCPPDASTRCPDNACRTNIIFCPTHIVCPADKPVKCPDGQCAVALEVCGEPASCTAPLSYKCPGGECAIARDLCPTHVTCPYDTAPVRCLDGTCRASLSACPQFISEPCKTGYISCPLAGAGVPVCATRLENCPTNMVCPSGRQVRCMDSSCEATISDCPPIPTYPTESLVPCADGTWASNPTSCSQGVTCDPTAPYKCWDGSCRISTKDCPVPAGCNNIGEYQCSNGACTELPWSAECRSTTVPCGDPQQVLCENGVCVSAAEIGGTVTCPTKYPTNCLDGLCEPTAYCPEGQNFFCRDGSCRVSPDDCPDTLCKAPLPFLCQDGACVDSLAKCKGPNGCPAGYSRCISGECKASLQECFEELICPPTVQANPPTGATGECDPSLLPLYPGWSVQQPSTWGCSFLLDFTVPCDDDGSCASSADNCPGPNGCVNYDNIDYKRCNDGTCVPDWNDCIRGDSTANACPPQTPYRCSNGFCSTSSTFCPVVTYNAGCTSQAPIQCADGSCAIMDIACPPVKECGRDEMRCGDGTCRAIVGDSATGTICPSYDSCPGETRRCRNGLCSPVVGGVKTACDFSANGCPASLPLKCNSGVCVAQQDQCPTIPAPNGCATANNPYPLEGGPVKCPDGSCAWKTSLCKLGNGCYSGEVKCPIDGSCVPAANYSTNPCPTTAATGSVTCPDGTQRANYSMCVSAGNGCPLNKPFRCADGSCAKFAAGTQVEKESVDLACQPVVVCSAGRVLCLDGSCQPNAASCPSLPQCPAGTAFCSLNYTCLEPAICTTEFVVPKCPQSQPMLCPSGECRKSDNECTGGTFGGGQTAAVCGTTTVCFDGNCYESPQECLAVLGKLNGITFKPNAPLEGQFCNEIPGVNKVCADGRCVSDESYCNIIPACPPGFVRCWDGSCETEGSCTTPVVPCPASSIRCEDGFCRLKCQQYDGCGINALENVPAMPYHCPNRECAQHSSHCAAIPPTSSRRVMAQTTEQPHACVSKCFASVKANIMDITISSSTTTASTFTVARGSVGEKVMDLEIPSGAVVFTSSDIRNTILQIRPVGESKMRSAINPIHVSRRGDNYFKYPDVLSFAQTVLSPAFQCYVSSDVIQPFKTNFTVTSSIDSTRYVSTPGQAFQAKDLAWIQDVCFAKLVQRKGYSFWSCLWGQTELRRLFCPAGYESCKVGTYTSGLVWDPQADDQGQPTAAPPAPGQTWKGASSFNRCIQDEGVEVGVASRGVSYAFIANPLQPYKAPQPPPKEPPAIALYILFGALGLLLVLCCGFYVMFRLSRYRKKYKKEKAEADRLHEEMENMEHFGVDAAGLKAGDVVMSQNPLAQQISSLAQAVDESELKLQQAEQQLKLDEAGVRANHIENMKQNRDKMLEDLNKLKAQLAATQQQATGGAETVEEDRNDATAATDQWAADDEYQDVSNDDFTAQAPMRRGNFS